MWSQYSLDSRESLKKKIISLRIPALRKYLLYFRQELSGSLIPETKGEKSLLKSYSNQFLQLVFITKFENKAKDLCLFGYMYVSVSLFFLDNIVDCWDQFVNEL